MSSIDLIELLNKLEEQELQLLSWGVVDGSFSEDEILRLVQSAAPQSDEDVLLDLLMDRCLVVQRAGNRFRTRMAETVRLASSLRQLFPGRDWRNASRLVSDYRFLSRSRPVPVRNLGPAKVIEHVTESLADEARSRRGSVVRAILGGRKVSGFQSRATSRILSSVGRGGGTCVAAGTGTGKTLAFYLPALTHLLDSPRSVGLPRVVAIYPRTELLRDQLRSLLALLANIKQATSIDLRVGFLYGATPHDRRDAQEGKHRKWKRSEDGGGLAFPIIGCIRDSCDGKYVWPDAAGEETVLVCNRCKDRMKSLVFTRRRLREQPPDIVFATTEMINRNLSSRMRKLFVGDPPSCS